MTKRHHCPAARRRRELRAEENERPAIEIHHRVVGSQFHADDDRGRIKSEVDQKDNEGCESGMRDEAGNQTGRSFPAYGSLRHQASFHSTGRSCHPYVMKALQLGHIRRLSTHSFYKPVACDLLC